MLRLAIVGRPNVGKSTLFNKLVGKALAIVNDTPGVTRDWREAKASLFAEDLIVIDTAGLEESFDDSIPARMRRQTEGALASADVILFLTDGRAGITPMDRHFASYLRKQKKPVILAVNKCENLKTAQAALAEAYSLGFGEPAALSAEHNEGMGELYEVLKPYFPDSSSLTPTLSLKEEGDLDDLDSLEGNEDYEFEQEDESGKPIKIAIVGRPNVGKSTLLNTILNEPRVMTGPEAGITRDAVAVDWVYEDRAFKLVDTAGLRRRSKVHNAIEKMAAEDSLRAIRLAQVVILVLDANAVFEKQDVQIADHVLEEGRALVVAVNKWDSVENHKEMLEELKYKFSTSLAQAADLPFAMISALHNRNIDGLLRKVLEAYQVWNKRIPTGGLNRWLASVESRNPAPLVQGRPNRLKYITQIKTRPPTFALWVSRAGDFPNDYKRYVINRLREDFDIPGVPIRLLVRASKNPFIS